MAWFLHLCNRYKSHVARLFASVSHVCYVDLAANLAAQTPEPVRLWLQTKYAVEEVEVAVVCVWHIIRCRLYSLAICRVYVESRGPWKLR